MNKTINSQIVEAIRTTVKERFIVELESDIIINLKQLAPSKIIEKEIIRLQRISSTKGGWRTFLVATLQQTGDIDYAIQWAASSKEEILDPQAADLYLIIEIKNNDLTLEQCISIEAGEKVCRKLILRPNEQINELIERTFLAPVEETVSDEQIMDPLTVALRETASTQDWFNANQQTRWRSILLSGLTGAELIDALFDEPDKSNQA